MFATLGVRLREIVAVFGACAAFMLWVEAGPTEAQQVTGELGSPSATTTIDGKQLPAPDPKFGGVIKDSALQSKAWWAPRIVPPKQAPNIILTITAKAGSGERGQSAA